MSRKNSRTFMETEEMEVTVDLDLEEDRSAYNCQTCGGDGLIKENAFTLVKCPNCLGTGKVN